MSPSMPPAEQPSPGAPLPFADGPHSKIFRFTYEGPPRPLRGYLLERYAYGRDARWRASFYPRRIRRNGAAVDEHTVVAPGDRLAYLHLREEEPPPPTLAPPLYEDPWLLVLHKPDSLPVNPSGVYYFSSLALLAREVFGNAELTPVHRLDLETCGPLLFAKRKGDLPAFHKLFQHKTIRKSYRALVHGEFPPNLREISGKIVPHPGSRIATKLRLENGGPEHSLTRIHHVRHCPPFSHLELEPVTGKTNQLRVHLANLGTPIVGDKKYHPDEGVFLDWLAHRDFARLKAQLLLPRQALQCQALEFPHPFSGEQIRVEAPPGSWQAKLGELSEGV
ncbi:MAG: RluA family pseudouridine synthase [SAR324 cluster bacterium]|nr:RluA family pseudouridine synthase [SAR324 cluster bacterium]